MWDTVIEPQDHKDQKLSLEQREAQKYQTIKDNFTKNLSHVPAEKIAQMTQDQNLIGVSAIWGWQQMIGKKNPISVNYLPVLLKCCHLGKH
jgi:hypothetical protein